MTGAVTVAAIVGLLSLLGGVALGWYLRRTNEQCPACGDQMACAACGKEASAWAQSTAAAHPQI